MQLDQAKTLDDILAGDEQQARYEREQAMRRLIRTEYKPARSLPSGVWDNALNAEVRLDWLTRAFPDMQMLVLDSFSTFEGTKENSDIAEMCPNLLFDTSLSYNFDFIDDGRSLAVLDHRDDRGHDKEEDQDCPQEKPRLE